MGGDSVKLDAVKKIAVDYGIKPGKMRKAELIRAIQQKEGNNPCYATNSASTCDQTGCCWREDCI